MPIDLIYREDAKGYARQAIVKGLNVLKYLDEVPTADFRPAVLGKWIPSDMQEGWITCSVCKKLKLDGRMALSPDLFEEWGLNFCPNCGADMRPMSDENV